MKKKVLSLTAAISIIAMIAIACNESGTPVYDGPIYALTNPYWIFDQVA